MKSDFFRPLAILAWLFVTGWVIGDTAVAQSGDNIQVSATFTVEANGATGKLYVTTAIDFGYHIFSRDEKTSIPTKIDVPAGQGVRVTGVFDADVDPHPDFSSGAEASVFDGVVTWSAPIELDPGLELSTTSIEVQVTGQICDEFGCNRFSKEAFASYSPPPPSKPPMDAVRALPSELIVRGTVSPSTVKPGSSVTVRVDIVTGADHTLPPLADTAVLDPTVTPAPTLLVFSKTNGWPADMVRQVSANDGVYSYEMKVDVPREVSPKSFALGGLIGLQTVKGGNVDSVKTFSFSADVRVDNASNSGEAALTISPGPSYEQIVKTRENRLAQNVRSAGRFASYQMTSVLALAFLAGLILNVMPCVLPVIGLKVMSFVQQAGEHPWRVFLLNYVFALGMLSVFVLLATLAVFANYGWGELFTDVRFQLAMIAVVFVFGLSFLGVWEIPLPGMVGMSAGKIAQREGFLGAFLKGILTTLLATPCSGPLLAPVLAWALAQPPGLTYLTFVSMGVGMAFPYLIVGVFPKLVALLPRPGEWMVTFKHLMGFAMLGAAIFLVGGLAEKYVVPALSMSLVLAVACWWIGRVSLAAELKAKVFAWSQGIALAIVGCAVAFYVLIPQHELEWIPYSKLRLDEELAKGNIVLVDFTADW